jgi:hypothetical protein
LLSKEPKWVCDSLFLDPETQIKWFPNTDFPLCTLCAEARLKSKADKKEEREEKKQAEADASNESSRQGTPIDFGLARRFTFGETEHDGGEVEAGVHPQEGAGRNHGCGTTEEVDWRWNCEETLCLVWR